MRKIHRDRYQTTRSLISISEQAQRGRSPSIYIYLLAIYLLRPRNLRGADLYLSIFSSIYLSIFSVCISLPLLHLSLSLSSVLFLSSSSASLVFSHLVSFSLVFLVCLCAFFVFLFVKVLSYLLGATSYFYSGSMINVMTYIWGRRNPNTRLSVFFISIHGSYLAYTLAFMSVLVGWNVADHFLGILVGHIYFFFEDIYPLLPTSKGVRIFSTPKFLLRLFKEHGD